MTAALVSLKLADQAAERVRVSHAAAIGGKQDQILIIPGVSLPSGTNVLVAHKLGRAPSWVGVSAIRGAPTAAGLVQDITAAIGADATKYLALQAQHFGATITVDLAVL